MATINMGDAKTCVSPASRRKWRAAAGTLIALFLMVWAGFGLTGCTFEFGESTSSTVQSATTVTQSTGSPDTTAVTNTTVSSSGTVTEGDGLASPAQSVGEILGPSVVNITMTVSGQGPFGDSLSGSGEGSGVIYTADGMIITNNHVVSDDFGKPYGDLTVTLATGKKLPATVVGTDPITDLAVIKVDAGMNLPAATFAIDQPTVGEYSIAIGSPMGFENSVTLGIVSALNRTIEIQSETGEVMTYTGLIQTDTPISAGNSGGALANGSGQVIGINNAMVSSSSAENIGFAIPAMLVTEVADEIIGTGKATHAYLGVATRAVTADLQQQFNLSLSSGLLVAQVTAGGPAAKAGIQQGDIITQVDGKDMIEGSDLQGAIRQKKPGDSVQVAIDRNGTSQVITVTLEERPANL
jgi:S1-C subfamily serine protease